MSPKLEMFPTGPSPWGEDKGCDRCGVETSRFGNTPPQRSQEELIAHNAKESLKRKTQQVCERARPNGIAYDDWSR